MIPEILITVLIAAPTAAWAADGAMPSMGALALRATASLVAVIALIVALAMLVRKLKSVPARASGGRRLVSLARLELTSECSW
jgi:flagellar biogenesis protein FliO